jgi:hypothetical protein
MGTAVLAFAVITTGDSSAHAVWLSARGWVLLIFRKSDQCQVAVSSAEYSRMVAAKTSVGSAPRSVGV